MSNYRQILYHIVFRTKHSRMSIPPNASTRLYQYIWAIIKNKKCILYRINGMEDHIHILCDLHPSIALSDYIKNIKVASSKWMKETGDFPDFNGWSVGYCALTYSFKDKDMIVNYIRKQQEHHKEESFTDELKRLLKEEGIEYDEKYFWND